VTFDPAFFTTPAFLLTLAAAFVAALVRGFTGFGAALTFVPMASAAFGPTVAAPTLLIVDFLVALPIAARALPAVRWRTVLPAALAATLVAPFGAWALAVGDPTVLRWVISGVILVLVALVASGLRYADEPAVPVSAAVGGIAGFLGGFAQITGPPIIALWVSGPHPAATIRANLFVFFTLTSLSTFAAYLSRGLFTAEVLRLSVGVAPVYALAMFVGSRLFHRLGGAGYRPLAYGVVVLAAITSMPLFDGIWR
jgi:uncharacterized membrane protein YfcA